MGRYYYILIIFAFFLEGCPNNIQYAKPSTEVINFSGATAFNRPSGNSNFLTVNITPPVIKVPASNASDCDPSTQVVLNIDWQMTDENEYIVVSISDDDGIQPGTNRMYVLQNANPNILPFYLNMIQGATQTVPLYGESWVLKINAKPVADETCNSGSSYPDPASGQEGWERLFPANTSINNQWTIYPSTNGVLGNVHATINYQLHLLNTPHCVN